MARYTVRVELHKADEDDYEDLHDYMQEEGFRRYITDSKGKWRDEAWPDHTVTEQMRQPSAIVRIGLVAAPVLHVRGVRQDHMDVGLEQVEDRLPVAPGALHHRVRASFGDQPSGETLKLANDRAKLPDLRVGFVFCSAGHDTDHDELLANIDAGASLQNRFDHLLLQCEQAVGGWLGILFYGLRRAPVRCT